MMALSTFGLAGAEPIWKTHLNTVGGMRPKDVHHAFIGCSPSPVLLQFKNELPERDRNCPGSVMRSIDRLCASTDRSPAHIGDYVDLEFLFQKIHGGGRGHRPR